jgi:hypothetical protein
MPIVKTDLTARQAAKLLNIDAAQVVRQDDGSFVVRELRRPQEGEPPALDTLRVKLATALERQGFALHQPREWTTTQSDLLALHFSIAVPDIAAPPRLLLTDLVTAGQEALWNAVAAKFPAADSSHLSPRHSDRLQSSLREAIRAWIFNNVPLIGYHVQTSHFSYINKAGGTSISGTGDIIITAVREDGENGIIIVGEAATAEMHAFLKEHGSPTDRRVFAGELELI